MLQLRLDYSRKAWTKTIHPMAIIIELSNTATTIVSWNMLEGTPEGVDGGLLLKTIEKYAQWIGFMEK